MSNIRGLILFSGGLDSILAAKTLMVQNQRIEGICFTSIFYSAAKAEIWAKNIGLKLHVVDISEDMLSLVKNPPSGYGKNLNPCIDCHALMAGKAGEYLRTLNKKNSGAYSYLASGEVLGQRPFSQNRSALKTVNDLAGVDILRPLSAKLLPETEVEKNRAVKRHKLFDIEGRSRHRQMELAGKYGITDFPAPAGGCLLTDNEFCGRLGKMLEYWPECKKNDVELLKNGRVFWLNSRENGKKVILIIGRNKKDNDNLEKLAKKGDIMVQLREAKGPLAIVRELKGESNENPITVDIPMKLPYGRLNLSRKKAQKEILSISGLLTGYYSTKARGKKVNVTMKKII